MVRTLFDCRETKKKTSPVCFSLANCFLNGICCCCCCCRMISWQVWFDGVAVICKRHFFFFQTRSFGSFVVSLFTIHNLIERYHYVRSIVQVLSILIERIHKNAKDCHRQWRYFPSQKSKWPNRTWRVGHRSTWFDERPVPHWPIFEQLLERLETVDLQRSSWIDPTTIDSKGGKREREREWQRGGRVCETRDDNDARHLEFEHVRQNSHSSILS